MFSKTLASLFALLFIAMLILVSASLPSAAKGGRQNASATGSDFALVVVGSTDGVAHWGHQVTFTVSTTVTTEPHVSLKCSQNGEHLGHQVTFTVSTTVTTEPHVSLKCSQNGVLVY